MDHGTTVHKLLIRRMIFAVIRCSETGLNETNWFYLGTGD